jgi:hypothetical protein
MGRGHFRRRLVEIGQTQLHLLQADGTHPEFKIHPQGMEVDRRTGLFYVTAVEIIEERDAGRRYWGKGRAHLFELNFEGNTVRSIHLKSDNECEYHPSGIVLTEETIFIALAQYAPDTSATIIKFDVRSWTYEKLFRIEDHIGLVVPNLDKGELFLGTWGSRHYYCTDTRGNIKSKRRTPCSDMMEHQDAQPISSRVASLGKLTHQDTMRASVRKLILATGVTAGRMEYFGLDIIDVASWEIRASLRWPSPPHTTRGGWPPFANPTFLWVDSYDRVLALATPRLPRKEQG